MAIEAPDVSAYFNELAIPAFDEAWLLYYQRKIKASQCFCTLQHILAIDTRLTFNFDHLRLFPDATIELSIERLALNNEGDAFVSAYLAFISEDKKWISQVLANYLPDQHNREAVATALAWMPREIALPWIQYLIASHDYLHKWLAIATCCLIGVYPKAEIAAILGQPYYTDNIFLHERILRLIAQTKQKSLLPKLREDALVEHELIQSRALWGQLLLGDWTNYSTAMHLSLQNNVLFNMLFPLLVRLLPIEESACYLSSALTSPTIATDLKIAAVGCHGDPRSVPWLIERMREPQTASLAAAAFYQITGMGILENALDLKDRQALITSPANEMTDIVEENISDEKINTMFFDPDETLPIADTTKLDSFWQRHQHLLEVGKRYLFGFPTGRNDATCREYLIKLSGSDINMVYQNANITLALFDNKQPYQTFVSNLFT